MNGAGLVLDSKIFSADAVFKVPAFHLNTADIQAAHIHLLGTGSEVTEIRDGQWFNVKDPDGNVLMICEAPTRLGVIAVPGAEGDGPDRRNAAVLVRRGRRRFNVRLLSGRFGRHTGARNFLPVTRSEAPTRSRYGVMPPRNIGQPAPRIMQRSMSSGPATTPSSSIRPISSARASCVRRSTPRRWRVNRRRTSAPGFRRG